MSEKRERLTRAEDIRRGKRKRRRAGYVVGALLLLAAVGLGAAFVWLRFAASESGAETGDGNGDGAIPLVNVEPLEEPAPSDEAVAEEETGAQVVRLSADIIDNVCYLNWDALKCDSYAVQMMEGKDDVWKTVKTVAGSDECAYVSPRLCPGTGYAFRVIAAAGGNTIVSEAMECEAAVTPVYCTVWPLMDLEAYSDVSRSEVAGGVAALDAHCVVAAGDGMFGIDIGGKVCYIDSNYCMINLPEYVGALCSYDVTNSYASAFTAHGFEIPGLTGEVIKGFEGVRLKDDSFLVPLLYPTARKLEAAIENARGKGFRLKIYEAFRPHEASVYMYRKASEVLHAPLPESTYDGTEPEEPLTVSEPDVDEPDVSGLDVSGLDVSGGIVEIVERRKTYWEFMNDENHSFSLGAFVSGGVSRHNLGVAMDLTLEDLGTGEEVSMQTSLHDLSQYSARAKNNEYAKELSEIMMSAGYGDLYSEWWHFQDNEIVKEASKEKPLSYAEKGVSPECWMTSGSGWRYRGADGTYAVDCTLMIDGKTYVFDSDGYLKE